MTIISTKYRVVITEEMWNGERSIDHDYSTRAQAQAVYERVNTMYANKGYTCVDEGNVGMHNGEGMCRLWTKDEKVYYNIEIYPINS